MRHLLLFSVLALLAVTSQAQSMALVTMPNVPTTLAAQSSVSPTNATMYVGKSKIGAVHMYFELENAGTNGPVVFTFARSVDGSTFESLASRMLAVTNTATGKTGVYTVAEVDPKGAGYVKLVSIDNYDEEPMQAIQIKYETKQNAP
jgi:hypothetical protein